MLIRQTRSKRIITYIIYTKPTCSIFRFSLTGFSVFPIMTKHIVFADPHRDLIQGRSRSVKSPQDTSGLGDE